jgi:hypothetical protein
MAKPRRPDVMSHIVAISDISVNIKKLMSFRNIIEILRRYCWACYRDVLLRTYNGNLIHFLRNRTVPKRWLRGISSYLRIANLSNHINCLSFPKLRTTALMRHSCLPGSSELKFVT